MDSVLKTHNLSKQFKAFSALNNVNIELEAGKIYGLIGKNGAGKTTLMRIIAGLSFPTRGSIELFGHSKADEYQKELKHIGCLIEYPSMNGNMTAWENMRLHRIIRGIKQDEADTDLLKLVGLGDTKNKKVKDFSLGMRQRLGIAIALIGNPSFVLLDEPVNGLDPVGVVEIRNLIKEICEKRHITVLISSHNLPELFQTATDYIIIDSGMIKKQLTHGELEECCKHHLAIECDDIPKLEEIIKDKLKTDNYKIVDGRCIKLYDKLEDRKLVSKTIYENGIIPTLLSVEGDTLEEYFISVIGGTANE